MVSDEFGELRTFPEAFRGVGGVQELWKFPEEEGGEDDLEPPFIIAVQGSSESGKTTLIKSLVHHYMK